MATMQATAAATATTNSISMIRLPPPSDSKRMKMSVVQSPLTGGLTSSNLQSQMLHLPHYHSGDALTSSGLDFLQEVHLRREQQTDTSTTAQKMTIKERTMIEEGCRRDRATILEEALKMIMDEDC
jgi:hypothetical protein